MFGLSFGTIKLIVIGLLIAAVVGYIGFLKLEVGHYKQKAEAIEAQYTLVINTQAAKLAAAEKAIKEQDEARQRAILSAQAALDKQHQDHLKEIGRHVKDLRSCIITRDASSVFNHDPERGPNEESVTGKTNTGNDGGASSMGLTGEDLARADAINYKNFQWMREIIKQFQNRSLS